jgi:copper chaperone
MGVAGVTACTVHLDTGVVRVTGSGVDAAAVIAAVTAENYSCNPALSADIDDDASSLRLLVIQVDTKLDSKGWSSATRAISQLPSVLSCIAVPSSSRVEIKGDSCLDGPHVTRELRRLGLQASIVSFSPFSHLHIQIGSDVSRATRVRIEKFISSCIGVTEVAIDEDGHLVVHGAVEPARIMLLLEDEGMSAQPAHTSEQVVVNFDGEGCDDVSPHAQRLLAQSSANEDVSTCNDGSSLILVVHGMTCGACVAHVNAALSNVAGADNVSVNLITGSAYIRNWNGPNSDLITAIESKGYSGHVVSAKEPINFTKQADLHLRQWLRIFYCSAFVFVLQSFFTPQSHLQMSVMSDAAISAKSGYVSDHTTCACAVLTT